MDRAAHVCACGEHGWVNLTRGHVSVFDPEFCAPVSLYRWHAHFDGKNTYARRCHHAEIDGRRLSLSVHLHAMVMPSVGDLVVDHRNGDTLDNRVENLRLASMSQNSANQRKRLGTSSRYRGVSHVRGQWRAVVGHQGRQVYLGQFASEEEAARAYDAAAKSLFGKNSRPNFPEAGAA